MPLATRMNGDGLPGWIPPWWIDRTGDPTQRTDSTPARPTTIRQTAATTGRRMRTITGDKHFFYTRDERQYWSGSVNLLLISATGALRRYPS
jgi:hypothetical protein